MKNIIYASLFILLICSFAFGQINESNEQIKCPTLKVEGPRVSAILGEILTFKATISEEDIKNVEIKWLVDRGKITQGQGTQTVQIKINEGNDLTTTVIAIVKVRKNCVLSASQAISITVDYPKFPTFFDEFGRINYESLHARLSTFLVEIDNNSSSKGYIINYGSEKYIKRREREIKYYIKNRRIDLLKFIFVNGGKEKEIRTRLWIVPKGADPSEVN